jgi:hypothetical protein
MVFNACGIKEEVVNIAASIPKILNDIFDFILSK